MSGGHLRTNTSCENCGQEVLLRFCPNCGQENVETRQSFHYLFTHFIEDFTHYENGFWKAMKYLLYSPVTLTKTYLEGKRKKFVVPVKLFIFINFIFFLLFGVFKVDTKEEVHVKDLEVTNKTNIDNKGANFDFEIDKDNSLYFLQDKIDNLSKKYTKEEILKKIGEEMYRQLPKALFFYLPIFAFLLWLFHNKRRWWFFEHGIFTFHFFSSLLLLLLLSRIFSFIVMRLHLDVLDDFTDLILFVYLLVLFYKSIYQMYLESKWKTFVKGTFFLFLNLFFLGIMLSFLVLLSFILIH